MNKVDPDGREANVISGYDSSLGLNVAGRNYNNFGENYQLSPTTLKDYAKGAAVSAVGVGAMVGGGVAIGVAAELASTAEIWIFVRIIQPTAAKIAVGSGAGYYLVRLVTGVQKSGSIYSDKFDAYTKLSRVSSGLRLQKLS